MKRMVVMVTGTQKAERASDRDGERRFAIRDGSQLEVGHREPQVKAVATTLCLLLQKSFFFPSEDNSF